jgi:phosphate transport system substrate-binding protein
MTLTFPGYAYPRKTAVLQNRLLAILFTLCFPALCFPAMAQAQPKAEPAPAAQQPQSTAQSASPTKPVAESNQAESNQAGATGDASAADPYVPREGISGSLQIVGSTTVQQAAALWADGFTGFHPEVKLAIDCRGSELAIPKLAKGGNVIAVFSRAVEPTELAAWRKDIDGTFQVITIGHDPVAVVVHPDNPLAALSWNPESKPSLLAKLAAAPSADAPAPANDAAPALTAIRWGDLGVTGDLADKPIAIYALDNTHGSRRYVDQLLQSGGADAARVVTAKKNQTELIGAVRADRQGLGFVRATVASAPGLKVLSIRRVDGPAINPLAADSAERDYPLVRPLTLLVSLGEKEKPNQLSIEFVSYVLSRLGQIDLVKDGLLPLSRPQIQAQQELLGQERLR